MLIADDNDGDDADSGRDEDDDNDGRLHVQHGHVVILAALNEVGRGQVSVLCHGYKRKVCVRYSGHIVCLHFQLVQGGRLEAGDGEATLRFQCI